MIYKHATKHDGRIYGRIESDEDFTKRIKHINKMIAGGEPVRYYLDKFHVLRVFRDNCWVPMKDLAEVLPKWRVEGVDE